MNLPRTTDHGQWTIILKQDSRNLLARRRYVSDGIPLSLDLRQALSEDIIKMTVAGILVDLFFEIASDVCFLAEVAAGQQAAVGGAKPFDKSLKQTLDRCNRPGSAVVFEGRRPSGFCSG